jgi:hypothetical protein
MILVVIPQISKAITKKEATPVKSEYSKKISLFSEKSIFKPVIKPLKRLVIAVWNYYTN